MPLPPFINEARRSYHAGLLKRVLCIEEGVPSNADRHNNYSVILSRGILDKLGKESRGARLAGQMSGNQFEEVSRDFIETAFAKLMHLRPGDWCVERLSSRKKKQGISRFTQYSHLISLSELAGTHPDLATALGLDYIITPDIIIWREPATDKEINAHQSLVNKDYATLTTLRKEFNPLPILHASISCKWTIRSDRSQNSRSEALNLIRNRKGRLPHIVVITGEPLPSRISSIAMGTGDIDCVYHFALPELMATAEETGNSEAITLLNIMVQGNRLRDIADLPLDLAI